MPKCTFGDGSGAVAEFFFPGGCVALRETKIQDLCMQHIINATPMDGMYLVIDFTVGHEFTDRRWRKGAK